MSNYKKQFKSVVKRDAAAVADIERLMVPDAENQAIASSCTITFAYTEYAAAEGEYKVFTTIEVDAGTPYSIVAEQMPSDDFPVRERGYWYFTGWSEDFSGEGTVETDMTVMAQFELATIKVSINWNGAENQPTSGNSLPDALEPFAWGDQYPALPLRPVKSDDTFMGAFITNANNGCLCDPQTQLPIQTHSSTGEGILTADSPYLGAQTIRTTGDTPQVIPVTNCVISVEWTNAGLVIAPSEDIDESSDESSSDETEYCTVTFTYTEPDGTEKTAGEVLTFEKGTPYSEIKHNVPATPSRNTGYWYFTGWTEDFSGAGQLTTDIVSRAQYEPAQVKIEIDWNGASNISDIESESWSSPFSWMGFFPDLTENARERCRIFSSAYESHNDWHNMSNAPTDGTSGSHAHGVSCLYRGVTAPDKPERRSEKMPCLQHGIEFTKIPEKVGAQFNGVFLFDGLRVLNRTHNADGKAIAIADNPAMGSRTEELPSSTTVWPIQSCTLKVVWGEPIQWNTQEDLRKAVGAIPCPFADDPFSRVTIPASDAGNDISFEKGFPESFVKPIVNPQTGIVNPDARVISRKIVNSLGNIGTQAQFFAQCGGYYTFDKAISDAIGGYPQGAFLRFYDADTNCLRTVYSLVDNNTWNFLENGVDGIHWKFVDDNPTLSLEIQYDDFIDLSNTLFVNSGIPDFYEVPYDSYLQMHALSYCDMHSTLRDEEQYMRARTSLEYNTDTQKWDIQVQEVLQGAFAAKFSGITFVDIYNENTNTTKSIPLRTDGSLKVSATIGDMSSGKNVYYQYKLPRYVVTQGALFLNKGDKIRIRGVYSDKVEGEDIGNVSRVHSLVLTDMEVERVYLMRFANLYRMGWRI